MTRFTQFTKEGQEFIKMWNKGYKDGLQPKLAEKFGISISTVYLTRKGCTQVNTQEGESFSS